VFEKILVAHDGSDGAQKAFDAAVALALQLKATLHMISVEENIPRYAETMVEVDEEKDAEDSYFGQLARRSAVQRCITSRLRPPLLRAMK
jgi:nucleotide-binding universal stress UspA family protein